MVMNMGKGYVIDNEGNNVLGFDMYAEQTMRKIVKQIVGRVLREHKDGIISIRYPDGDGTTIVIATYKKKSEKKSEIKQ